MLQRTSLEALPSMPPHLPTNRITLRCRGNLSNQATNPLNHRLSTLPRPSHKLSQSPPLHTSPPIPQTLSIPASPHFPAHAGAHATRPPKKCLSILPRPCRSHTCVFARVQLPRVRVGAQQQPTCARAGTPHHTRNIERLPRCIQQVPGTLQACTDKKGCGGGGKYMW
eukprot:255723-Chlamydomonas_euryale.AAC.2